jgi:hypothetical protein
MQLLNVPVAAASSGSDEDLEGDSPAFSPDLLPKQPTRAKSRNPCAFAFAVQFSHCLPSANLRPLASLYAQRQNISMQRIQTLRGAVAAEEVPDFTGKCLGVCFVHVLIAAGFHARSSLFDRHDFSFSFPDVSSCHTLAVLLTPPPPPPPTAAGMLLRDCQHVGVEVASISLAEIEQQERALEGTPIPSPAAARFPPNSP